MDDDTPMIVTLVLAFGVPLSIMTYELIRWLL